MLRIIACNIGEQSLPSSGKKEKKVFSVALIHTCKLLKPPTYLIFPRVDTLGVCMCDYAVLKVWPQLFKGWIALSAE